MSGGWVSGRGWSSRGGAGYQRRINAVLRAFMQDRQKKRRAYVDGRDFARP
jgi:hypothetical protein